MKRKNIIKFIIVILMFFLGSSILLDLFKIIGINPKEFDAKDMNYFSALIEIIFAFIVYSLYRMYIKADYKELKNGFKKYLNDILKYLALFMVIKIAASILTSIVGLIIGVEIGESENQNTIINLTSAAPLMMLISSVIFAPIAEEGIFRLSLRKIVNNKYLFILLSGLIFGLIHIFPTELSIDVALTYSIVYVTMGMYFAYIYVETDNIWIPIIVHALNNLISMLAIIFIF